jgi:hypothetical protein
MHEDNGRRQLQQGGARQGYLSDSLCIVSIVFVGDRRPTNDTMYLTKLDNDRERKITYSGITHSQEREEKW